MKGKLSVIGTREVFTFMANPNELKHARGVNYPTKVVPGMSSVPFQFVNGSAEYVQFQLFLDGDRGRLNNVARPQNTRRFSFARELEPTIVVAAAKSKSVRSDVDFLLSLTYSVNPNGTTYEEVAPPELLFTFGETYQGERCVITECNPTFTRFNVNLQPTLATVAITLMLIVDRSKSRSDVFTGEFQ